MTFRSSAPRKGTPEALLDAMTGRVNVSFSPLGTQAFVARELKSFAEVAKSANVPTF